MSAAEMAAAQGRYAMRRTGEACDVCGREASNALQVWLISNKPEPSNQVCCECEDCLATALKAHQQAQSEMAKEAHPKA